MSHSVRLRRRNDSDTAWEDGYVFAVAPFIEPKITLEHDDQEPPMVSAERVAWKVTAKLYGADNDAVKDAWLELRAAISNPAAPAQGIQFLHDDTVIEEISSEGGYDEVKIESLASPESDAQWMTEMVAVLTVSGVKRLETGGSGTGISTLTQRLTYAYGEEGLLTKTLEGELTVTTGFSAEAVARTLGLELPSTSFAYVTRGPEGVDITLLDRSDRRVSFTSSIQESGVAIPGGVGPGFSVDIETTTVDGEEVTTTTVTAEGPEAVAAVKSKRPSGKLLETQAKNDNRRTARAVYITKKTAPTATPLKKRVFTTTGGGRPIRWTRRTGGRSPIKHVGAFAEVVVEEIVTLERTGSPEQLLAGFFMPRALVGVDQDTNGSRIDGPDKTQSGKDANADVWQVRVHRRYVATDFSTAFAAVAQSALNPENTSTVGLEVDGIGKGLE